MRSQLLVLGLLAGGVAGLGSVIACGSTTTTVVDVPSDASVVTVDGQAGGDAGEPVYDLPSTALDPQERLIYGIIGDQVIVSDNVSTGNANFYAVPLAGGAETTIFTVNTATDDVMLATGAIAHWSNLNASEIGNLDVWTPATGLKTGVATASRDGLFASNDAGTRIAFLQDATATSASIAVRDLANATNLVTLSGADSVNLAALKVCAPGFNFSGGTSGVFFAFECTGTNATVTNGRIYTVANTPNATAVRIDGAEGATDSVEATQGLTFDLVGDKIAYVNGTTKALEYVNVNAPGAPITLDTGGIFPFFLGDGSAVIYAIDSNPDGGAGAATIKKATTAATPALSTIAQVNGLEYVDISPDAMKLVFAQQEDSSSGATDLYLLDFTQATPAVQPLITTVTGSEVGFTGDSKTVVWADIGTMMRSLTLGGTAKDLGPPGNGGLLSETGTDLIVFSNPVEDSSDPNSTVFFDVGYTDAVGGGNIQTIATLVPNGQAIIKGKRLVYNKAYPGDTGIFAIDLP